jgi:hypothetical protein
MTARAKREFRRDLVMRLAVILALHPLLMKVAYFGIAKSPLPASARSPGFGVFCVFLMNARTSTTRRPTAVT